MTIHHQPDATTRQHLDALAAGAELALAQRRDKATARDAIWLALSDALLVIEDGSDRERAWLRGDGSLAGRWGEAGMSAAEAIALGKLRILAGLHPLDHHARVGRQADADRAMVALSWLRWLSRFGDDAMPLHRAVVEMLRGDKRDLAASIYRPNRTRPRQVRTEIKSRTVDAIVAGLHGIGIVPGQGCSWLSVGDRSEIGRDVSRKRGSLAQASPPIN